MRLRPSLRLRVAGAFAATTAAALIALGVFVYDRVERTLVDQTKSSLRAQLDALGELPAESRASATRGLTNDRYGQLLGPDGRLLASSPQVFGRMVEPSALPEDEAEERFVRRMVRLTDEDDREMTLLMLRRQDNQVLAVGTSEEDISDTLQEVASQLLIGGPLLLLLASGIGYLVAGVALRPVEQMRSRAALISDRHPAERLPLPAANDEIRRLGETLNAMLDRLEAALSRERRFVAEASHELRTPLALLRMELDLALSRPRSTDELLAAIGSANDEVERLTRLSEDLLLLAGSTEQVRSPRDLGAPIDVTALLRTVAARFATRAAAAGREVRVLTGPHVFVSGDHDRLDRALSNLVDNALVHGAGDIDLAAEPDEGHVRIEVTDEGTSRARLGPDSFQAFAADPAARRNGSRGLGLAIVRAIVEQHQGTVTLAERTPGRGTAVTVVLPLAEPA
jgi:signal transduction histidine kinase